MRVKDKQGRPVFAEQYNAVGEPILLGKRVAYCPSMPAIGLSNKPIALGDFGRFIIRVVKDMQVQRLGETFAEFLQVGYQAFLRADAGLQVTTGDSPIKFLQNAAS
jgi:HK97 family phage major capsid protein